MGCKEEGYQRIVKEKKIKEIVAYLSGKSSDSYPSILPSNILIALDNIEYDETTKKLIIKDNESGYKGLIIDGQHRAKGGYEFNTKFELLVVAIGDLEPKHQARLFITINKTQTPLPTSLYMDLISTTSDEDIRDNLDEEIITAEQKATEIIRDFLIDDEYLHFRLESVFLTIKNLESDFETINENEFVSTSLDKLLLELSE